MIVEVEVEVENILHMLFVGILITLVLHVVCLPAWTKRNGEHVVEKDLSNLLKSERSQPNEILHSNDVNILKESNISYTNISNDFEWRSISNKSMPYLQQMIYQRYLQINQSLSDYPKMQSMWQSIFNHSESYVTRLNDLNWKQLFSINIINNTSNNTEYIDNNNQIHGFLWYYNSIIISFSFLYFICICLIPYLLTITKFAFYFDFEMSKNNHNITSIQQNSIKNETNNQFVLQTNQKNNKNDRFATKNGFFTNYFNNLNNYTFTKRSIELTIKEPKEKDDEQTILLETKDNNINNNFESIRIEITKLDETCLMMECVLPSIICLSNNQIGLCPSNSLQNSFFILLIIYCLFWFQMIWYICIIITFLLILYFVVKMQLLFSVDLEIWKEKQFNQYGNYLFAFNCCNCCCYYTFKTTTLCSYIITNIIAIVGGIPIYFCWLVIKFVTKLLFWICVLFVNCCLK